MLKRAVYALYLQNEFVGWGDMLDYPWLHAAPSPSSQINASSKDKKEKPREQRINAMKRTHPSWT